jgi:hypothetical protein
MDMDGQNQKDFTEIVNEGVDLIQVHLGMKVWIYFMQKSGRLL